MEKIGKFCLHLLETKQESDSPFIFACTYFWRDQDGKERHVPIQDAIQQLGTERLAAPLAEFNSVCENNKWLQRMKNSGAIGEAQRWNPDQAMEFLEQAEDLQQAGAEVHIPDWWGKESKISSTITFGGTEPSFVGKNALTDFKVSVSLDPSQPLLTDQEIKDLAAASSRLVMLRGKWVCPDREMLADVLKLKQAHGGKGIDAFKMLRFLAREKSAEELQKEYAAFKDLDVDDINYMINPKIAVAAGDWAGEWQTRLTNPGQVLSKNPDPNYGLQAVLRPYQQTGAQWILDLQQLGLGGILADDMGLGKTIQVLAAIRQKEDGTVLLIVPASLLTNWRNEAAKFAPDLQILTAHSSHTDMKQLAALDQEHATKHVADYDIVLTTYGTAQKIPWLKEVRWHMAVLDEAQAIKNPTAAVTRFVKKLQASQRLILTGTPIENRINDLWSLMNFANPGLLGGLDKFRRSAKQMQSKLGNYSPLQSLVQPYLLRRLKTDKSIIPDLPDKSEMRVDCWLTRKQAALYQDSVVCMEKELAEIKKAGNERNAVVLKYLTRFKQICNHPANWLQDNNWDADDSGKFQRLKELAENIGAANDKMLVFTQYKYMTAPLANFLEGIFGMQGLVLHGSTAVSERPKLVEEFQENPDRPFMVLSLKAGGTGLNLTAANHVVHFDRWWNPAVENQATDRAYRIGQHRNVLVHHFTVCGTLEERIDAMIKAKQQVAKDVLGTGSEISLTELSNAELLDLVALDIGKATAGL